MASLNKLAIRGIRSFDDKQIAVIEFFSPVTVIVGHNGSGKTTIIECLKYATTGDQPPNSRGGAFVHDPKMANEKEVKAQVKLRFVAANGQRMLAVRNLSVSVKKTGALTMKTLESILSLADGNQERSGKRATISTKCAEIDSEIPHLLGVSKAVLENVIFCHQEDSYWPLAEPAALKKKFDDIFEATRYTKALNAIKDLRKERVSDLKAEKERLESLSREKSHADKLRARISDLQSTITVKETRHEKLRQECDQLIAENKRFYDSATKFREKYVEMEHQQKQMDSLQESLEKDLESVKEMTETDEQLEERVRNAEKYKDQAKMKRSQELRRQQDVQEELEASRKMLLSLQQQRGGLEAQKKQHEKDISERDAEIRRIADAHHIKGYETLPLERQQILGFFSMLEDMQKKAAGDLERLQNDAKAKTAEFHDQESALRTEHELLKQQRSALQNQISSLQSSISKAESELLQSQSLSLDLAQTESDIEDRKKRVEKVRIAIQNAKYDTKLQEITFEVRSLEEQREILHSELKNLSLQADARAKLDLKRVDLRTKSQELKNITDLNNAKFRKHIGLDIRLETMERDVDRVISEKERETSETEINFNDASGQWQRLESTVSNLKTQLKQKQTELKGLDEKLRKELTEFGTVQEALDDANAELEERKRTLSSNDETIKVFQLLKEKGKRTGKCSACNRPMNEHESRIFEEHLGTQIAKITPEVRKDLELEASDWEAEIKRLQSLLSVENTRNSLKSQELPRLDQQIRSNESSLPELASLKDAAQERLEELRRELKELSILKQQASNSVKLNSDVNRLKEEIARLEEDLSSTGSVKTADSVQEELEALGSQLRKLETKKVAIQSEREQQGNLLRRQENELHSLQLQEGELRTKVRDQSALSEKIVSMQNEVGVGNNKVKDLDEQIKVSLSPLSRIQQERKLHEDEMNESIRKSQIQFQELRRSSDFLGKANRAVESYIRANRGRDVLQECDDKIEQRGLEIQEQETALEEIRNALDEINKELHESQALALTIAANERIRRTRREIAAIKGKIEAFDMEEAARARRQFDTKYLAEKRREADLEAECARIGGELGSLKDQQRTMEKDLADFKDINKLYTDQLIKVKMSDMANNDLEKYAKALDSAIMKYHSLKMGEVNDTMRHLWLKTYQGTDIDGIKICSDIEGGASKRSYNYRVVMTKDQVEMDMRGRCSAGQKMLASIIIRLALSDSFGQNCGILALDEPTNALDVENIDALASSLVDIINERKNHANFQLIIITHDENFLRKLGQANVMEYYWRVSRDARQKSIIERQRVG